MNLRNGFYMTDKSAVYPVKFFWGQHGFQVVHGIIQGIPGLVPGFKKSYPFVNVKISNFGYFYRNKPLALFYQKAVAVFFGKTRLIDNIRLP